MEKERDARVLEKLTVKTIVNEVTKFLQVSFDSTNIFTVLLAH